jgi:hypothetical protein
MKNQILFTARPSRLWGYAESSVKTRVARGFFIAVTFHRTKINFAKQNKALSLKNMQPPINNLDISRTADTKREIA